MFRNRDDFVTLKVFTSKGRYFIRHQHNEVTAMLNRFDRIEPVGVDTIAFPPYASWAEGKGLIELDEG